MAGDIIDNFPLLSMHHSSDVRHHNTYVHADFLRFKLTGRKGNAVRSRSRTEWAGVRGFQSGEGLCAHRVPCGVCAIDGVAK